MSINPAIFKAYDIRGIYPDDLNEETIVPVIQAIYTFFLNSIKPSGQLRVVLSYDMRLSGPKLYETAKATLLAMGAHIIDIGKTATPTFYFAVSHYGYDCGIQITASHNPKEWNGMKFVKNSSEGLIKIGKSTGMTDIQKMTIEGIKQIPKGEGTIEQKTGILEDEVTTALQLFDNPTVKKCKIVADPANAMGATYIDALFKKIPADLIKMNFELDGSFPAHQPDPLNFDNLKDLQKRVLEEKADFGLAPDGDGDRLYFIDEKGQVVPATIITALVAREMLKTHPGAMILFDIRYILGAKKIVEEFGGKYDITKVGHAFITEHMTKTGAVFAGESSGHFYYQSTGNAEDQVPTILSVLKVMTEKNKPLSEIAEELHRAFESGEYNFKVSNAQEIIEKVKLKYRDGELSTVDGVSVTYPNWRFNIRTSNTEPLLRLNVESYEQKIMEEKRDELTAYIKNLAKTK